MSFFTSEEFDDRVNNLQRSMQNYRLDAIVLTSPENFYYYSGFFSDFWQSPTRPWFLIIPREGERILVIPEIGISAMQNLNIHKIYSWSAPNPKDDGVSLLCSVLEKLPCRFACIGWEMGHESIIRMPIIHFDKIRSSIKSFRFSNASPLIWAKRMIKSESEISYIRKSCQYANLAFDDMLKEIQYGDSEFQVAKKMTTSLIQHGSDKIPFISACSDKQGYNQIIAGSRDTLLNDGSILFLDVGATYRGYFCDFNRNFGFGEINDSAINAYQIVNQAIEEALKKIRVKMTCQELCKIILQSLQKHSQININNNVGRLGHGLGLQLTEPPSLSLQDSTELQEGMVITLEPGFEFSPNKMIVLEENIVIRSGGCELLTKRAWDELPIINL